MGKNFANLILEQSVNKMKKQSEYPIIGQKDDPVVFNGNLA